MIDNEVSTEYSGLLEHPDVDDANINTPYQEALLNLENDISNETLTENNRYSSFNCFYAVLFFNLGLCNNFAYVVILSAAYDLLSHQRKSMDAQNVCNYSSTGLILLADILPGFVAKLFISFYYIKTRYRITAQLSSFTVAFLLLSYLHTNTTMTYVGVVCVSLAGAIGEITFVSYAAAFHRSAISAWASGTGMAGVAGALFYATLISFDVGLRDIMLTMFVCPCAILFACCFLFSRVQEVRATCCWTDRMSMLPGLLHYMVPLMCVYFFEYFINQGILEFTVYQNRPTLTVSTQYSWLQLLYQLGVLVSRSSVLLFRLKHVGLLATLQAMNALILFVQATTHFIPYFALICAIVFYEGLIGGFAYVNTFYSIYIQTSSYTSRRFVMSTATLSDTFGIALAGFASLPVHYLLCYRYY